MVFRSGVLRNDNNGMQRLMTLLAALVRGLSLVGLLAVTFGPAYSKTFLRLFYSTNWSETDAPAVLSVYCAYVPLLAINGEGGRCHQCSGSGLN